MSAYKKKTGDLVAVGNRSHSLQHFLRILRAFFIFLLPLLLDLVKALLLFCSALLVLHLRFSYTQRFILVSRMQCFG